jgi:hypothetical protein
VCNPNNSKHSSEDKQGDYQYPWPAADEIHQDSKTYDDNAKNQLSVVPLRALPEYLVIIGTHRKSYCYEDYGVECEITTWLFNYQVGKNLNCNINQYYSFNVGITLP